MYYLQVTDNNFTIVDTTIRETIKQMYFTVPPSSFHLVTYLDILSRHLYAILENQYFAIQVLSLNAC